ncbi:MAG: hypothetical protein ACHQFZ_05540 [Acidimicrobiales bacterium]
MTSHHRLTRFTRTAAIAVLLSLAWTSLALAAWTDSGTGSGAGAGLTMPSGNAPTATAKGGVVTVSWSPAPLVTGDPVGGYVVARYNVTTGVEAAVGGSCSAVLTVTTCSESVPPGTWTYTDTPIQDSWTGAPSADGAPVVVALT